MYVVKLGKSTSWKKKLLFLSAPCQRNLRNGQKIRELGTRFRTINCYHGDCVLVELPLPSHRHLELDNTTRQTRSHYSLPLCVLSLHCNGYRGSRYRQRKFERHWSGVRQIGTSCECSKPNPPKHNGAVHTACDGNAYIDHFLRWTFYEGSSNSLWDLPDR